MQVHCQDWQEVLRAWGAGNAVRAPSVGRGALGPPGPAAALPPLTQSANSSLAQLLAAWLAI